MTSLTMHLLVVLAATVILVTASSTVTRGTTRSSTQVSTLRAPHQRSPPTTSPIDIYVPITSNSYRGRIKQTTTPQPATSSTPLARYQRPRSNTMTTTTTTNKPSSIAGTSPLSRDRGTIRASRQPRNIPKLSYQTESRISSNWIQSKITNAPTPYSTDETPATTAPSIVFQAGTLKTPRMIQRLVAGHIQNAQGHSTYEVSAVSSNSSSSASIASSSSVESSETTRAGISANITTKQLQYGRRKPSSSFHMARPLITTPTEISHDDDEALLSDPDDFDNWDNGILRLSAGSGKETAVAAGAKKSGKEDTKKTLADQVRDGKYGLIEKEIFRRIPKRPGVLSYARNSEIPEDNERNFGGLNEQDIWLAEDHLLVIKGGGLNVESNSKEWPPIDDYDAPARQIKLPDNPVKPPPFPVQLEPNGPLQLIPNNQLEIHHTSPGNGTIPTKGGKHFSSSDGAHATHSATRSGATTTPKGVGIGDTPTYIYPAPYAPWLLYPNETLANGRRANDGSQRQETPVLLRPSTPLLGNWLLTGLNGNSTLPSVNVSDFDEDDPSLYYPPAYSFVYKSNYTNPVSPGPLVPGIVVPPPSDHFSRLDVSVTTASSTTPTPMTTTSATTTCPKSSFITPTANGISTPQPLAPRTSFKPKYNAISYLPPKSTTSPPRRILPKYVERVPVPVAVPIPIYPINYTPLPPTESPRVFVPSSTTTQPPLSKSNPIYYEYFEAKQNRASVKSNVIDDFLATKPPKRHHFKPSPSSAVNEVKLNVADVVKITPKPRTAQIQALHAEYNAALGQLLRSNLISPPQPTSASSNTERFKPPDFDRQPFLPLVNYSLDEHDQKAFKAILYQPSRQRQFRISKHQQLQLDSNSQVDPELVNTYSADRQLRTGKQQNVYEPSPPPFYLEVDKPPGQRKAAVRLRPPAQPLQFWQQRPPPPPLPQLKRIRQGNDRKTYPPYFIPGEPLYRLLPIAAPHKHTWRSKSRQPIQVQPQSQSHSYYPDRNDGAEIGVGVNIGHSLAGDILVNYNTNNQFNSQAELVPHGQLGPPPLSYQAQSAQGLGGPLWSERERPIRQSRAQLPDQ